MNAAVTDIKPLTPIDTRRVQHGTRVQIPGVGTGTIQIRSDTYLNDHGTLVRRTPTAFLMDRAGQYAVEIGDTWVFARAHELFEA